MQSKITQSVLEEHLYQQFCVSCSVSVEEQSSKEVQSFGFSKANMCYTIHKLQRFQQTIIYQYTNIQNNAFIFNILTLCSYRTKSRKRKEEDMAKIWQVKGAQKKNYKDRIKI